jgi:hypothetical protein
MESGVIANVLEEYQKSFRYSESTIANYKSQVVLFLKTTKNQDVKRFKERNIQEYIYQRITNAKISISTQKCN